MKLFKLLFLVILSSNFAFADVEMNENNCRNLLNYDESLIFDKMSDIHIERSRFRKMDTDGLTARQHAQLTSIIEELNQTILDLLDEYGELSVLRYNCINAGYGYLAD